MRKREERLAQGAYNQFRGTFDGQGYSINGIYCVRNNMDNKQWGFFTRIGVNGVVKNLKLQAAYFENMEQTEVVGGIAGYNLGRIENCHVDRSTAEWRHLIYLMSNVTSPNLDVVSPS